MADCGFTERPLVDALDEPALSSKAASCALPTRRQASCSAAASKGAISASRSATRKRSNGSLPTDRARSTSPALPSLAARGGWSSAISAGSWCWFGWWTARRRCRPRRCGSISSPTQVTNYEPRSRPCSAMPKPSPKKHDLPDELRSNFGRTIRDEARRMLRIIEDLMSLSRIEADRFVVPGETVDSPRSSIRNRQCWQTCAASGQCEFAFSLRPTFRRVRGDRAQLVQLLDNLVSNAVRYGCDRPDSRSRWRLDRTAAGSP